VQTSQAAAIALRRAFGETVDPDGHVPRPATESRLEALSAWCRSDGAGSTVAALIAPPGIGKTHLLRVLESRLREGDRVRRNAETPGASVRVRHRALYLPYAALTLPDLARWIHGLVGERRHLRVATADPDEDALRALAGLGAGPERPLHLLIDDADSMPSATLRALVQGLARAGLGAEILDGLDPRTVSRIRALSGGIPRRIHRVVLALVEPDRASLARALATSARSDAWLGRPIDDSF
jgi:hypothetical protein